MPTKRVVFEFDERDKLSMEELAKRGVVLPCVLEKSMTQDERIEKLEREVAELRGAIDVLMSRTFSLQTFGGTAPPMCEVVTWNHIHGTCGPIVPIRDCDPPNWNIESMIEEGRKQMLTPEGERLVREAKQQDLPQCHL